MSNKINKDICKKSDILFFDDMQRYKDIQRYSYL